MPEIVFGSHSTVFPSISSQALSSPVCSLDPFYLWRHHQSLSTSSSGSSTTSPSTVVDWQLLSGIVAAEIIKMEEEGCEEDTGHEEGRVKG